jgi:Ca2+-binding RTX toxin-like protein
MATLDVHAPFDMLTLSIVDLLNYDEVSFSTSLIRLFDDATHYVEFSGSGFVPNFAGQIVGGTLTGIELVEGVPVLDLTGLDVPAATFYNLVAADDRDGTLSLLFAGNDSMTGSTGADALLGYAGNDTLSGGGGLDTLIGGAGNDLYVVKPDNVVTELAGEGTDTVRSARTWTLGTALENLVLTGGSNAGGSGNNQANVLTGNNGDNVLRGQGGKDTLAGGTGNDVLDGGAGNDRLGGGAGADTFHFAAAIDGASNVDTINGFVSGTDRLRLDNDVFSGLPAGDLAAGRFAAGPGLTSGQDAGDRIVLDTTTGRLYYDADGNGPGAAIAFAALGAGTTLLVSDILVVN